MEEFFNEPLIGLTFETDFMTPRSNLMRYQHRLRSFLCESQDPRQESDLK